MKHRGITSLIGALAVSGITCGNGGASGEVVGGLSDASVQAVPPAPELPSAGGSFVDPTFGTTIYRVTDADDGLRCNTDYSYTPAFNATSTRFWIMCVVRASWGEWSRPVLYDFDPDSGAMRKGGTLFDREVLAAQMHWSARDADRIYGVSADRLYEYDVTTRTRTEIANLGTSCPEECYAWQLSKSADDRYFAAHMRSKSSGLPIQTVVWDRQEPQLRVFDIRSRFDVFDESHLDKGGRWLMLKGEPETFFWSFRSGTVISSPRRISHYDTGNGFVAHGSGRTDERPGLALTNPLDPAKDRDILLFPPTDGRDNWVTAQHLDVTPSGDRAFMGTYVTDRSEWFPLMEEIVEVRLDGSGRFRRLAHHRSRFTDFGSTPRGNVDPSGRWFIYTSNWDGSGRNDVFLLRIPEG